MKKLQLLRTRDKSTEVQGYRFLTSHGSHNVQILKAMKLLVSYAVVQTWHAMSLKPKDVLWV